MPDDLTVAGAEGYPAIRSFNDYDLKDDLLRGISAQGLEDPRTIQQHCIKPILDGRDTIVQGESGTGKTAALIIGCLERVDCGRHVCQALVLVPTRERAQGVQHLVFALGGYLSIRCHAFVGGSLVRDDIDRLREGQQLVAGTPYLALDMIQKRHLCVDKVRTLVLCEADDMLSRGGRVQIYGIFETLSLKVQVCLSSATMPPEVLDLSTRFTRDVAWIRARKTNEAALRDIRQFYVAVEKEEGKIDALCGLLGTVKFTKALVYCNSQRQVSFVAEQLTERNVAANPRRLAGPDPREGDPLIRELRYGSSRLLISTDMLGRGIDGVCLVVNLDLPLSAENYIHRVDRRGHFGQKGVMISFVTSNDAWVMKDISQYYHTEIKEMTIDVAHLT